MLTDLRSYPVHLSNILSHLQPLPVHSTSLVHPFSSLLPESWDPSYPILHTFPIIAPASKGKQQEKLRTATVVIPPLRIIATLIKRNVHFSQNFRLLWAPTDAIANATIAT